MQRLSYDHCSMQRLSYDHRSMQRLSYDHCSKLPVQHIYHEFYMFKGKRKLNIVLLYGYQIDHDLLLNDLDI